MKILLDTNAFIWWVSDDKRLGKSARSEIANPKNPVYVSNLSLFECSIKARIGKLKINFGDVDREISEGRLIELRFDTLCARQYVEQGELPQSDPFDAALVAQAISKRMVLVTSDHHILRSTVDGLRVMDASR
jgi:PIN domain nuclease of toxin-antitoxin system